MVPTWWEMNSQSEWDTPPRFVDKDAQHAVAPAAGELDFHDLQSFRLRHPLGDLAHFVNGLFPHGLAGGGRNKKVGLSPTAALDTPSLLYKTLRGTALGKPAGGGAAAAACYNLSRGI
jgi:hypothetical protein